MNRTATLLTDLLLLPLCALAQDFGEVEGYVTGPDGKGIEKAVVGFDRLDYKLHAEIKTDKKGYFFTTVRSGDYKVTCTVNGNLTETRSIHIFPGRQADQAGAVQQGRILFKLDASTNSAATPAAAGGSDAAAAAAQRRAEQISKQNNLNGAFTAGVAALEAKQYNQAVDSLNKAAELDPKQLPVWQALADAYMGLSRSNPADSAANRQKAYDAFAKAIEVAPTNAGTYNNYALALAEGGKLDEAKQFLGKAIEIDPAGAGKYHFNLATILTESGQAGAGRDEFKKATDADPNNADAWFQYGVALASAATVDAAGKMVAPPGSLEALRKYLALKPDGANAQQAREMITALGGSAK